MQPKGFIPRAKAQRHKAFELLYLNTLRLYASARGFSALWVYPIYNYSTKAALRPE